MLRTIKSLAADPRNAVWIISGRDQAFLDEWMGHIPELGLSAEHGCFIRKPRSDDWENLAETSDMAWQKDVMEVFQHYAERTQGSFIERKRVALTWHYRRADPEYGAFQARECRRQLEETVGKKWDVEVMAGKANLEVRPTFVNKGFIATRLVNEYGTTPGKAPDFILCLGDDFTDEGMSCPAPAPAPCPSSTFANDIQTCSAHFRNSTFRPLTSIPSPSARARSRRKPIGTSSSRPM